MTLTLIKDNSNPTEYTLIDFENRRWLSTKSKNDSGNWFTDIEYCFTVLNNYGFEQDETMNESPPYMKDYKNVYEYCYAVRVDKDCIVDKVVAEVVVDNITDSFDNFKKLYPELVI